MEFGHLGRGPTTTGLGDLWSPWLLTTYVSSRDDPPSKCRSPGVSETNGSSRSHHHVLTNQTYPQVPWTHFSLGWHITFHGMVMAKLPERDMFLSKCVCQTCPRRLGNHMETSSVLFLKFPQLSQTFGESNFGFSSFQKVSKKNALGKQVATLISINLTPKSNHSCHKKMVSTIYTMFSRHIPFPHPHSHVNVPYQDYHITIPWEWYTQTPQYPPRTAASAPAHEDLKGPVFCWMFQEVSTWLGNGL